MRKLLTVVAAAILAVVGLRAQEFAANANAAVNANVNERYTIESVELRGVDRSALSRTVREELDGLIGQQFNERSVERIFKRLMRDFPDYSVSRRVSRGAKPDHVKISFELRLGGRRDRFELSMPKGVYSSRHGWTGEVEGTANVGSSSFSLGVISDGDQLIERYAGLTARYENRKLGTEHARLAFDFESYHNVWNGATLRAVEADPATPGIYRTRQNFQPVVTILPVRGLKAGAGVSFQRFQVQYPAAHTEAANAVIGTLRYDRTLESSGPDSHRLGAGYALRAATKSLDSDFAYTRHSVDFDYGFWRGPNSVTVRFTAGALGGTAPIFDRFVLGNTTTLRGWNKYDVAPLGGERMVHNSLDYRYRALRVFYDTGAVWMKNAERVVRHAAGIGLQAGDFALLIAFPIRNGRAEPVFMAGMNL